MPVKLTPKGEAAVEYITKYGTMPDGKPTPIRKLSRMLYHENKLLYRDEEEARFHIRARVGKSGNKNRHNTKDKSLYRKEPGNLNPYGLPDSDEVSWEPFILNGEKILVLSDIHIPYHNIQSITAAFDYGKKRNPDTILLNGDTIDCYKAQSKYSRDPRKRDFAGELNVFRDFITAIRNTFPKANIVFKEGNHEERYNRFLYEKANELVGVEEFNLENIIRTRAGQIDYIGEKRIIKAGNLNIIHGHEFAVGFFNPVNVARGLFLRGKVSALQGHNHQTSEHTETDMNGRITTTWSLGCLSELHPQYMPINKWNHGAAFIEVSGDGDFEVHNKRIKDGKVL